MMLACKGQFMCAVRLANVTKRESSGMANRYGGKFSSSVARIYHNLSGRLIAAKADATESSTNVRFDFLQRSSAKAVRGLRRIRKSHSRFGFLIGENP